MPARSPVAGVPAACPPRDQDCPLSLERSDDHPPRAVLGVTVDGRVCTVPDGFWHGGDGSAVLTRAELAKGGISATPGSAGRLRPGGEPRLNRILADLHAHLAATWRAT